MESSHVQVSGGDMRELKNALFAGQKEPMLSVDPILNYNQDYRGTEGERVAPTTKFRVRWRSVNESFVREVKGLKELYDVLKPIFKEYEASERRLEKLCAEKARAEHRKLVDLADQRVKEAKEALRMKKEAAAALRGQS